MMMPANYSVIAENEMTYVNGGASFIDAIGAVTAPIWNLDNVKAFSTNIVTLIGNNFVTSTIQNTLGYVFGGSATKSQKSGSQRSQNEERNVEKIPYPAHESCPVCSPYGKD